MRSWIRRGLAGFVAAGLFAFFFLPLHAIDSTIIDTKYLSLADAGPGAPGVFSLSAGDIPPDCSTWHELYPAFCAPNHQDVYRDNGDGCVSACDIIELSGVTWHVAWVGPTYYLTCFDPTGGTSDVIWEPNQEPHNPESPVCETWEEVWPNFGVLCHIDDWVDNDGSGTLTPCDDVFTKGLRYHIDDIKLNIIVEPPSTPTKQTTWGKLKQRISPSH